MVPPSAKIMNKHVPTYSPIMATKWFLAARCLGPFDAAAMLNREPCTIRLVPAGGSP